ncbi:MAG: hypothetical protein ACHP7N_00115 [Caulobacterales bacterium]
MSAKFDDANYSQHFILSLVQVSVADPCNTISVLTVATRGQEQQPSDNSELVGARRDVYKDLEQSGSTIGIPMHRSIAFALVGFALLAAAPAFASDEPSSQSAQTKSPSVAAVTTKGPAKDPNDVICKHEEVTGSRIPKSECLTRREWDEMAANARAAVDASQTSSDQNPILKGN